MNLLSSALALITVTGSSTRDVAPDEVVLRLGVETRAKTLALAKEDNDRRVTDTLRTLGELGVAPTHVRTERVQMAPHYAYGRDEANLRPLRYEVERELVVRLEAVETFDAVVTAVLNSGVTHIRSVTLAAAELDRLREEVQLAAVAQARAKATRLVEALGARLGPVFSVREGGAPPDWRDETVASDGAAAEMVVRSRREVASPSGPTLAAGIIGLRSEVVVQFRIEEEH